MKIFGHKNEAILTADEILLRALINNEDITKDKALTLPAVSSAVSKITNMVAMIPFKLYEESVDSSGKRTVKEVNDNRVSLINDETHDTLDGMQFKKALVTDYLLGKGGYAYIDKMRNKFIGLHYVDEGLITFTVNTDPIKKLYRIICNGQTYYDFQFIKLLRNTKNGAYGTGLSSEISKALQTAYSALTYQLKSVKSGGSKRGFVKSSKKLSQGTLDELKEAWRSLYSEDSENVVVLNDGIDFKEASATALEMQLNQIKSGLNSDIKAAFGIYDDDAKFFKYTISPILTAIQTALNRDFLLESEKGKLFWAADTKEIIKESMKDRFAAYNEAIKGGWMELNEARYFENWDAVPGLDIFVMSLGNIIYDPEKKMWYVPNTGESTKGGEN